MDLWNRLSDDARQAIITARNLARTQGCNSVTPEHLALGILQQQGSVAREIFQEMGVNAARLRDSLMEAASCHAVGGPIPDDLDFDETARRCLQMAEVEARKDAARRGATLDEENPLSTAHLLLGLVSPTSTANLKPLRTHGVFYGEAAEILRRLT